MDIFDWDAITIIAGIGLFVAILYIGYLARKPIGVIVDWIAMGLSILFVAVGVVVHLWLVAGILLTTVSGSDAFVATIIWWGAVAVSNAATFP